MEHVLPVIVIGLCGILHTGDARGGGRVFQKILLAPGLASGIGVIITGILFLGFGTVVALLRRIKDHTDPG